VLHPARVLAANLIQRLIYLRDDVEAVEDMQGVAALLANDLPIGTA
jgi:hypothetical protein